MGGQTEKGTQMTTTTTAKKNCPICSKSLSYSGGVFSNHGYKLQHRRQTNSACFGAYKSEDGLIDRWVAQMKTWKDEEAKKFPESWLQRGFLGQNERSQTEAYSAYRNYRALTTDIQYFNRLAA